MEKTKKFLSLLLVFTLMVETFPAFAIVSPADIEGEEEEVLTPQNPPGTPAGVQCSVLDQSPNLALGGVCCVGLELNSAGKCDEPAFSDPAVTSCTSNSQCGPGYGCFPQTVDTLYSNLYPSPDDEELQSEKKSELESQVSEVNPIKPVGGSCVHARECQSYSCVSGICEDKKICRKAAEGEVAGATALCGPGLVKNMSGVCELSPEAQNGTYLGLLNEVTIEPIGQCQFKLDEDTRKQALIAMKSLRAMEWFFSQISLDKEQECFDVMPLMKDQMGKTFVETRKNILANFTEVLNGIEEDFKDVLCARQPDDKTPLPPQCAPREDQGQATLEVHGDTIAESDLATRQTSGFDTLMLMYRRNLLFQSYENSMLETVTAANTKMAELEGKLSGLSDNTEMPKCEGSKYKKKKFLGGWKTKYYTKVKDHWAFHYEVTGSAAGNADIVKRDGVKKVLAIIGGTDEAGAVSAFTKSKYYLMDPMMFAGLKNSSYGGEKKLKKKSSFLGLFGGFKDLRKARYLKGDSNGSYTKMHNDLKPKLDQFYKDLKIQKDQKGFVYEPELLTTEAKDCLDNPANPEACAPFRPFMDDVLDETFAHFLAWGYATDDSYSGFFSNAQTYRRALLRKLITDMTNISKYYTTIIDYRNQQNSCIEAVMNGLADSGILTEDPNGLNEGGVPTRGVNGGSTNGSSLTSTGRGNAVRPGSMNRLTRTRYLFNLQGNSLTKLNDGALYDSIVGTKNSSDRAGIGGSASALLSQREDALRRANAKAKSKGVKIADKEKAVKDVVDSMTGKGSGSAFGSTSGSSSSRGSSFGANNPGSASVSANEAAGASALPTGVEGNKGEIGIGANAGAGDNSGIGSGIGNGLYGGVDQTGDPNAKDRNGLTDADKDRMLSEYERNKKEYQGTEDDGLFKKVSKAYVRNLDKVLIRKKKLEQ